MDETCWCRTTITVYDCLNRWIMPRINRINTYNNKVAVNACAAVALDTVLINIYCDEQGDNDAYEIYRDIEKQIVNLLIDCGLKFDYRYNSFIEED